MVDVSHYTYRVLWSAEDQEFVGLCAEFPSLSCLEGDHVSALTGIIALVTDVVADMDAAANKVPVRMAICRKADLG